MKIVKTLSLLIAALCAFPAAVFAGPTSDVKMFHVDSINGTRWADTIVVYRGIASNGQNQWGENLVVNAEGVITQKIPGGDASGADLAVPEGGLILTGTGDIGKEMYACAQLGWHVYFDEYTMTAFISQEAPEPFFDHSIKATGTNGTRLANTLVIYDRGATTGTNQYGFEVCVNESGRVVAAGGNDSAIPRGGFVISAIEPADKRTLATYFPVGAKVTREGLEIHVEYDASCLRATAQTELELLIAEAEAAKSELRLVDFESVASAANEINAGEVKTFAERDEVIKQIKTLRERLIERRTAEVRAVWYRATERDRDSIAATVEKMAQSGINELIIDGTGGSGAVVTLPEGSPFRKDGTTRRIDVVGEYIALCHEKGIRVALLIPVMSNHLVAGHNDWYSLNERGEKGEEAFYSPACAEYREAFFALIRHVLTTYDVDGLQLDYIRYPYSDGTGDYGFDGTTIAEFKKRTGLTDGDVAEIKTKLSKSAHWKTWREFKTALITEWVSEISAMSARLRPDVAVSAAVAASGCKTNYCQDANGWIESGTVDALYSMSYGEGINSSSAAQYIKSFEESGCLVMGCGAYMSLTDGDVLEQTANSALCGTDGTAYFEWSAYLAHGFADLLEKGLFAAPATHFFDKGAAGELIETAKKRFALYDELNGSDLASVVSALGAQSTAEDIAACIKTAKEKAAPESAERLVQDLVRALRAVNTAKDGDFAFDPANYAEESAGGGSQEPTLPESAAEAPSGEAGGESSAPVQENAPPPLAAIIGAAAAGLAAVAAATVILIKRKKK